MPTEPAQVFMFVFELSLLATGIGLLGWVAFNSRLRQKWLGTHSLRQFSIAPVEFVLGALAIFMAGTGCSVLVQLAFGRTLAAAADHEGLQLVVYNLANYAGALLGWKWVFPAFRRAWQLHPAAPTVGATRATVSWAEACGYGAGTLLVAIPVVTLVSVVWIQALRACGLPDEPQDLIGLFRKIQSPWLVAGMLFIACVCAPIYEELVFRAGIFRYLRQKLGRGPALLISGLGFAALHGNWAGLLPLATLGVLLAISYEVTGSIRVPIVAHSLFNLNTIVFVLSGLQDLK